ncbi:hypothetical protein [Halomonas sp. A11-A]|uniref:hypothetical protein n=1 Tax=Halomonas sp. A11-A TaxID=2183985 RepID=UPI000D7102AB|nr:hypothetical protein [Halomonas sp. A11-A]PWV72083.1 hypothetical protein DER72_11964 [Halomonas sp. A11-A]
MTAAAAEGARRTTYSYFAAFVAIGMSGGLLGPSLTGPLLEWSGTGAFAPLLIGLVCLQAAGLVLLHHRIRHCAAGVPQGEPPG